MRGCVPVYRRHNEIEHTRDLVVSAIDAYSGHSSENYVGKNSKTKGSGPREEKFCKLLENVQLSRVKNFDICSLNVI